MRSGCCGMLTLVYKEDTDDVLNSIMETCPASQKSCKNPCKRPGQKLSWAERAWPPAARSEGVVGSRSYAVAHAGPGLFFSQELRTQRPPLSQPEVGRV